MQFNGKELTAILKMAKAMVMADKKIEKNELIVLTTELLRFGVPKEDLDLLLEGSDSIEPTEALGILANLDDERKKYVSSYLATIMASDGDIDDKEVELWQFVSTICGFPRMNIADAIKNMANL